MQVLRLLLRPLLVVLVLLFQTLLFQALLFQALLAGVRSVKRKKHRPMLLSQRWLPLLQLRILLRNLRLRLWLLRLLLWLLRLLLVLWPIQRLWCVTSGCKSAKQWGRRTRSLKSC